MYSVMFLILMKMSKYNTYAFCVHFFLLFFSVIHAPLPSPVDKVIQ